MRLTPSRILRAASVPPPKSYSSTLHLPKSTFPARPPIKQPSPYLGAVTEDLYNWNISRADDQAKGTFVLHDGPPYANGPLHVGHALNKISKDIINRFHLTQGQKVQYIPGWDCHGLPIEVKALQSKGARNVPPTEVRRAARALAEKTVTQQMAGFKSWGVMGDWENAYRTMDISFELRQLAVVKGMVQKGLIYRQHKPVYWSPSSRTALAESELEYMDDHRSTAAFVAYPLTDRLPRFQASRAFDGASIVVWTTTPWTLPANRAVAVNENLFYCLIEVTNSVGRRQKLIIEESCIANFCDKTHFKDPTTIAMSISGAQLVGSRYINPLYPESAQPVIHADFVTSSSGTGLVHMAPGHGMEDYEVCMKNDITAFAPVDDEGRFTAAAYRADPTVLAGKLVQSDGIDAVLGLLKGLGEQRSFDFLLGSHEIRHRYPIDWRTKLPVIVRATKQWFADVNGITQQALDAIDAVKFIPDKGRARLESFTKSRSQWCISRQRAWGVPIPALYRVSDDSNTAVMTPDTISHIMEVFRERGTDAWWTDEDDDARWIPPGLEGRYVRGKDTMDVWFDSGTTWTMLDERTNEQPLADVYFEGSDQHRGWFQSSLLTYVANRAVENASTPAAEARSEAPFGTLITHGFTLDQDGKKMSKSLGNVISPDQIMDGSLLPPVQKKGKKQQLSPTAKPSFDGMGPDALRLWVASSDYTADVVIGKQVLENINKSLAKYRITFKWILGVLADFDPQTSVDASNFTLADRIALHQLSIVSAAAHDGYSSFSFFKAAKSLDNYVNADLSAFYFELLKDRLYAGVPDDRHIAQAVLWRIFNELLAMLSPITPFMVEEVWQHLPATLRDFEPTHPLRREWKPYRTPWHTDTSKVAQLDQQIAELRAVHEALRSAAEEARRAGKMGTTLDCDVEVRIPLRASPPAWSIFAFAGNGAAAAPQQAEADELVSLFVVSGFSVRSLVDDGDGELPQPRASNLVQDDHGDWRCSTSVRMPGWAGSEPLLITVGKPKGAKCARCWRWVVNEHSGEKDVCGRCEQAIKDIAPH